MEVSALTIAWLDTTSEEQRVARELIALFTQVESRDELGVGQVRDAFSEMLFPGTSVVQTRARYFLFVPWCYRDGRARGTSGERCRARGDAQERRLIKALKYASLDDAAGLIGVRAGTAVKTLPSAIYWSALRRYQILTHDTDASHLGLREAGDVDPATELADRHLGDWHGALPDPPDGFPEQVPSGFELSHEEAAWLAERVVVSVPGTALSHLIERRERIPDELAFPWEVIPESRFEALAHARRFSTVMHGAALLYNLLVAERYERHPNLTRLDDRTEYYRVALEGWHESAIAPITNDLAAWDVDCMWQLVSQVNPRVPPSTRLFVDAWVRSTKRGQAASAADNRTLRQLVHQREARKGKQSRLANDKMLATWSGASGAGQLDFRWPTVRRLVNDIVKGLVWDAAS